MAEYRAVELCCVTVASPNELLPVGEYCLLDDSGLYHYKVPEQLARLGIVLFSVNAKEYTTLVLKSIAYVHGSKTLHLVRLERLHAFLAAPRRLGAEFWSSREFATKDQLLALARADAASSPIAVWKNIATLPVAVLCTLFPLLCFICPDVRCVPDAPCLCCTGLLGTRT